MVQGASRAQAACTPASANNVTATCSGTTTNQGGGAPGTSAANDGYGTGTETGITVNISAGAGNIVTGNSNGIYVGDGTVINNAGATITGINRGIDANTGIAIVTNSGNISSSVYGIIGYSGATVVNNAGANITGVFGIFANQNLADVTNFGSITSTDSLHGVAVFSSMTAAVTNNVGGSITGGSSGIFANHSATVTNFGNISGIDFGVAAGSTVTVINNAGGTITSGNIAIDGRSGSSIFNAGTIASSAINAIVFIGSDNMLTLAPGSVITGNVVGGGADTFQLGGTGTGSFNVTQIGPAAQYQGFSTFNKIDNSTWTLTGTGNQDWSLQGGTLIAGSNGLTGTFTVSAGALGGGGTIGSLMVNSGGTVAPGVAIPFTTLNVANNTTFVPGGIYRININGAGQNDKLAVGGSATLTGGSVQTLLTPGSYTNQSFDILHATGGLGGTTFSGVSSNLTGFAENLSYTPTDVFLNLTAALGANNGLTVNQQNVAISINKFFNNGGTLPPDFVTLFGLTGGNLRAALSQASGETATASQQTTFNAMGQFIGLMTDPFIAGRGDGPSGGDGSMSGYADADALSYASKRKPNDALAAIYTKAPPAPSFAQRWSTWVAGYGGSQSTDGNAVLGSNNTTSSVYGTAVGADYRFSPNTLAGFAIAGGGTNFSVSGAGSGRSDLFQGGAFIRNSIGPAYISAALAYGWQDVTTNRAVSVAGFDQYQARFNANAYSGRVEGGYRFVAPVFGGIGLTPYAASQFTTFDLPSYAESVPAGVNTFALAYGARSVTDTRSELGLRSDKSFIVQGGIFTVRGRAAWAHDYDPDRSIGATFQTLPGASFVVNGAAQAQDSALITASAEMKWTNGWSTAATFEGEFSDVTRSYAGKGVVRYTW